MKKIFFLTIFFYSMLGSFKLMAYREQMHRCHKVKGIFFGDSCRCPDGGQIDSEFQKCHVPTNYVRPRYFGPEFVFTSDYILRSEDRIKLLKEIQKDWLKTIKDKRGDEVKIIGNLVVYKDFWYAVEIDINVIEIQTKPSTLEEFIEKRDLIHKDIFEFAHNLYSYPFQNLKSITGGGHIHLDVSGHFHERYDLFRNFMVDVENNAEVYAYILGNDHYESPVLADLEQDMRDTFIKILNKFDNYRPYKSVGEFADEIRRNLYTRSMDESHTGIEGRYHALNLINVAQNSRTLEMRSFRPQQSIDEFILIIQLLNSRIDYLSKKSLIPYENNNFNDLKIVDGYTRRDLFGQYMADQFFNYVTKSNLDWKNYTRFLPPALLIFSPTQLKNLKQQCVEIISDLAEQLNNEKIKNLSYQLLYTPTSNLLEKKHVYLELIELAGDEKVAESFSSLIVSLPDQLIKKYFPSEMLSLIKKFKILKTSKSKACRDLEGSKMFHCIALRKGLENGNCEQYESDDLEFNLCTITKLAVQGEHLCNNLEGFESIHTCKIVARTLRQNEMIVEKNEPGHGFYLAIQNFINPQFEIKEDHQWDSELEEIFYFALEERVSDAQIFSANNSEKLGFLFGQIQRPRTMAKRPSLKNDMYDAAPLTYALLSYSQSYPSFCSLCHDKTEKLKQLPCFPSHHLCAPCAIDNRSCPFCDKSYYEYDLTEINKTKHVMNIFAQSDMDHKKLMAQDLEKVFWVNKDVQNMILQEEMALQTIKDNKQYFSAEFLEKFKILF